MTVALGLTFWMNTWYGFNVLSAAHWQYLSSLQAMRAHVKIDFYLSLVIGVIIAFVGLYLLVRPRFRKIPMEKNDPLPDNPDPLPNYGDATNKRPMSPSGLRSGTPQKANNRYNAQPPVININALGTAKPTAGNPLAREIVKVFKASEYTIKECAKVDNLVTPVLALGYDNTLWIGTSDVSGNDMLGAIQALVTVFDDTLGDTARDIIIHGCIINPTDDKNPNPDMISMFKTLEEFQEFMKGHNNTKPDTFDKDLFDAMSTYIDTVCSYIGKR